MLLSILGRLREGISLVHLLSPMFNTARQLSSPRVFKTEGWELLEENQGQHLQQGVETDRPRAFYSESVLKSIPPVNSVLTHTL